MQVFRCCFSCSSISLSSLKIAEASEQNKEISFYLTRYAARQRSRVKREAPKISGRARPRAGEGKYLSCVRICLCGVKKYTKPCHKRLIFWFHKWKKNDPGSVVRQPQSSQQEAKLTKPELMNCISRTLKLKTCDSQSSS